MRTWWPRLVVWLARKPIAELEARIAAETVKGYERGVEIGWERGVGAGYSLGWNGAMFKMRAEMEAAQAEIAKFRAMYAPPKRGAIERVH